MKKLEINPKIIESLGLSQNEATVFGVLLSNSMARKTSVIAETAKLPRTTVIYILRRLEKRKISEKILHGKTYRWKYKRGLEFLERRHVKY